MRLSAVQTDAMYAMREFGAMSETGAAAYVGRSRRATMRSLERAGLARWYPTPEHWKLTRDGKAWLNDEDAQRALAEHRAKTEAAVRAHREAKPIVDGCEDCGGTGSVQQNCEDCGEPLTDANWKVENEGYVCCACVANDSEVAS